MLVIPKFANMISTAMTKSGTLLKNIIIIREATAEIVQNKIIDALSVMTRVTKTQASEAANSADPENIANKYMLPLIVPK